jgi:hypothetical protein
MSILRDVHWFGNMRERQFGGTMYRWNGRIKICLEDEKI